MSEREGLRTGMEIALIGLAGRFPGARDAEEFWQNLRSGVESISFFDDDEMIAKGESAQAVASPHYVKAGRIIEDDHLFDAAFFGFNPREAELIDPQQRLFLECAWEALEHAGYDSERFRGLVGVYAGAKMSTYVWNLYSNPAVLNAAGDLNVQIANDRDYVATRASYKLGLSGPSVNVQSACSTSLVAVHLACQGLLAGETDMALAGGVSVRTQQIAGYFYREGDILSPDGRVRAFDAGARGTIFGSGLGVVVLRRLEDALADGDHVLAVILGSAVNNDGPQRIGFTAPGVDGQERVIRAAHRAAGIDPATISYVEAHGTGTAVGDPIEVTALTRAFRARTDRRGFCALGSVKTNIGHLASAAGVAGLIKTALALDREELPPSLNFERANPQIDFDSSPFFVQSALAPWPRGAEPRRAGVSAFGIGGTNAHAVLEEAPAPPPAAPSRPRQLLVLSARSEAALDLQTARLAEHLERHSEQAAEQPLADVAYTLALGRRQFEHRRFLVAADREEAREALATEAGRLPTGTAASNAPQLGFLFSGQGAQHLGMLAGLARSEAVYRRELERAAEGLRPLLGLDLREVIDPAPERRAAAEAALAETRITQPALFAVEHALARQLMAWGLLPQAMLGHSIGEYVAACLAGVFTFEDALALVAARGRLMQAALPGAMLSVPMSEDEVASLLGPDLALAAINGPRRVVVAGSLPGIAALEADLAGRGIAHRRLHTSHAFHSPMMEPILPAFAAEVARVPLGVPERPFVSNVTGRFITAEEATDPDYWVRHLRGTVRFADALATLYAEPDRLLVEVGPGQTLAQLARQHPDRAGREVVALARQPKDEQDDLEVLLAGCGRLWIAGASIDWRAFYRDERRRRVPLPTYPFERRRYFIEPGSGLTEAVTARAAARRQDLADWFYVPYWKPSSPARAVAEAAGVAERVWILGDGDGLGAALADRLRGEGCDVLFVPAVAQPGEAASYERLFADASDAGGAPHRIVHALAVGATALSEAERVERCFHGLVALGQALGRQKLDGPLEIAVVATGLFRAEGDEPLTPEVATLLGPVKVLSHEDPRLALRALDVLWPPAAEADRARTIERLAAEIRDPRRDVAVALRGGRRLVQGFEPVRLEAPLPVELPLVPEGVYLVTGGFGGIGRTLAEWLARDARARLVLTGRTPLPERSAWPALLAADPGSPAARAIDTVLRLEELGAEVLPVAADVADPVAMQAAVAQARERFGPIRGAIHTAGLAGGGIVQTKERRVADAVLAPKVAGTRVLERALENEPLDFLALCSSTIAIYGNFGQVDYAAANNFLDAFAEEFSARRGIPAVAIGYGAWRDVGMAVHGGGVPAAAVTGAAARPQAADLPDPAFDRPLHPLVHALVEDRPERKVFLSRFAPGTSWVLDEHRVAGAPTMPGTGCLEMARAAFELAFGPTAVEPSFGQIAVELADVFFLAPLAVPSAREARVVLERAGEAWRFTVASRAPDEPAERGWREHALGTVRSGSSDLGRRDLGVLGAAAAERTAEITGPFLADPEGLVHWGARWQSLRRVGEGDGVALARLELEAALADDLPRFGLHPALLDVATALGTNFEPSETPRLPFSYRRLRMARPLPAHLWSALTRRSARGASELEIDVLLLDDDGTVLVEIEGFSLRSVGAAGAVRLEQGADAAGGISPRTAGEANAREAALAESGMSPAEGLEAFRRVLAARPGSRVAVSPRDLLAVLAEVEAARSKRGPDSAGPARETLKRSLRTPYAAPRTPLETTLAEVWQDALALDQVGIDDNFYELGGDSVLGIQITARSRDRGVELQAAQLFEHQTIAALAAALGDPTGALAERTAPAASVPFALAGLSPQELSRALAGREAEDAYPLSPLQQGFLFHTLAAGGAAVYIEQVTSGLAGDLDERAMVEAWRRTVDRHPALRTFFAWEGLPRPLQFVAPRVDLAVAVEDLRDLPAAERARRVTEARRRDRETPFDLARAPLMRVRLQRIDERFWELTWSHHHLLMDGWSSPLVTGEVLAVYEALRRGEEPPSPPARPFASYIAWLEARGLGEAERFFARRLAGFEGPTPFARARPAAAASAAGAATREDFVRRDAELSGEVAAGLRAAARDLHATLATLVAAGFALLLGQEAETDDVVYGVSVSGRPPELAGVEEIVGCFINALPSRVRIDRSADLGTWLEAVQAEQAELGRHSHAPLVEAQRWAGLRADRPLFEALFEFWNFPSHRLPGASLERVGGDYDVATDLPLSLRVIPEEQRIVLQLTYDRRRFDADEIDHKLGKLKLALGRLAARRDATPGAILDALAALDRERVEASAATVAAAVGTSLRSRRRAVPVAAALEAPVSGSVGSVDSVGPVDSETGE